MGFFSAIKYALNSTLGTDAFQPLDEMITNHGIQEFTSDGTFTVPDGIYKIRVTACAGGGGGGTGYYNSSNIGGGGGGGGGACIKNKVFDVVPGQIIDITIGAGGNEGEQGGNTIIGTLITLVGGYGGKVKTSTSKSGTNGGNAGDMSAGGGGGGSNYYSADGHAGYGGLGFENGFVGYHYVNDYSDMDSVFLRSRGGRSLYAAGGLDGNSAYYLKSDGGGGGGGGGGSLGAGGNGALKSNIKATNGILGGGGGGGSSEYSYKNGAKGGDGYCLIEW